MRLLDRPLPTLSRAPASWKSGVSEFVYPTQSRITDEFQGGHNFVAVTLSVWQRRYVTDLKTLQAIEIIRNVQNLGIRP
jgi:hypothetical protein